MFIKSMTTSGLIARPSDYKPNLFLLTESAERAKENAFVDYVSHLADENLVVEEVEKICLADLFQKLNVKKPNGEYSVYFWKQIKNHKYEIYCGFGAQTFPQGSVYVYKSKSIDEGLKTLFDKGGVRTLENGFFSVTTSYKPEVIIESVDILASSSEYLRELERRSVKRGNEDKCETNSASETEK